MTWGLESSFVIFRGLPFYDTFSLYIVKRDLRKRIYRVDLETSLKAILWSSFQRDSQSSYLKVRPGNNHMPNVNTLA